ncbi:MAG: hypothetical protein ACR2MD_19000 [Aridibacter sp.]
MRMRFNNPKVNENAFILITPSVNYQSGDSHLFLKKEPGEVSLFNMLIAKIE